MLGVNPILSRLLFLFLFLYVLLVGLSVWVRMWCVIARVYACECLWMFSTALSVNKVRAVSSCAVENMLCSNVRYVDTHHERMCVCVCVPERVYVGVSFSSCVRYALTLPLG